MPFINCEVSFTLTWSESSVITSKATRDQILVTNHPNAAINNPTGAKFDITDTKLYVPVVTLSAENDNKFLEKLKTGFKEQSNGINIDPKCLIRLEITI